MESKMNKKGDKIISITVILLLITLVVFSILDFFFIDNANNISTETATSFILAGLGLFIASSFFLPKLTIEALINDKIESENHKFEAKLDIYKKEQSELISELKQTFDLENNNNKIKLLKIESHECRMNAFFLLEQKKYSWALGWALKSLYKYEQLFLLEPFSDRYIDLLEDLNQTISDICKRYSLDLNEENNRIQSKIKTRYFRYFKCISLWYETGKISDSTFTQVNDKNIAYCKAAFTKILQNNELNKLFINHASEVDDGLIEYILQSEYIKNSSNMKKNIKSYFKRYKKVKQSNFSDNEVYETYEILFCS